MNAPQVERGTPTPLTPEQHGRVIRALELASGANAFSVRPKPGKPLSPKAEARMEHARAYQGLADLLRHARISYEMPVKH